MTTPLGQSGHRCPHCGAPDIVLKLLTSMTKYVACARCRWGWEIAVTREQDARTAYLADPIDTRL